MEELRRTPLYQCHLKSGAKFTGFGGWEMPVQYSGLVDEHQTVRQKAGLFDVSHMGEITVKGKAASDYLQYLTSNDISKLYPGKAHYSLLLNENGGVVDDIIIYQIAENDYFICVNAANTEKDFAWMKSHQRGDVEIENVSNQYAQIAIQGPATVGILSELCRLDQVVFSKEAFPFFTFKSMQIQIGSDPVEVLFARTGYTGEDGFELFLPASSGAQLWESLLELGKSSGLKPIGLGARDTLRLEVCYPLHGHELTDEMPALSCGVGWVIKFNKPDFIGREALVQAKEKGLEYSLVGLEVTGKGIIRHENLLFSADQQIGWVTSGTMPPTVNKAVALAFVKRSFSAPGSEFEAEVRGKRVPVKIIETPFLKR